MAPGTQLTITFDVGAKICTLRPCHRFPCRFEEPVETKADAMDVDDYNGAAPMLVEPRPAEDHVDAQASGGARGRRAPLVVHDGALRAQPSTTFSISLFPSPADHSRYDESRTTTD